MFHVALVRAHGSWAVRVSVAAGVLAMAACTGDAGRAATEVRDSAGITIVQNAAPAWGGEESWRLSEAPVVDIGVVEGAPEDQLFNVRGATRLPDGRVVVANAGTHELRFYSEEGAFIESAGGEGDGPGEFRAMGPLHRPGVDSLLVWGNRKLSMAVFNAEADYVRSFRLGRPLEEEDAQGWLSVPADFFGDGTVLASAFNVMTCAGVEAGVCRDPAVYLRYDRDGVLLDSLGRFPGPERFVTGSDESRGVNPLAFGRSPHVEPSGRGFYFGTGDSFEIAYYDLHGGLQRLIRSARPDRPVTGADIRRFAERQRETADDFGPAWEQQVEIMLREIPYPETMPAYDDLVVDEEGNLWVRKYRTPDDEEQWWSVFDGTGRFLGRVRMPPGLHVYEIGTDYVLGLWRDTFDVEHVRLYGLQKTP